MISIAIVVDEHHASEAAQIWRGFPQVICKQGEDIAQALQSILQDNPYAIVVHGDDRLIGRVVSTYYGQLRYSDVPLRLIPMAVGSFQTISNAIEVDAPAKKVARSLRNVATPEGVFDNISLPCLKISSSMEEVAQYGFSFGAGWLYHAFEYYHRRNAVQALTAAVHWGKEFLEGKDAAAGLTPAQFSIDFHPTDDAIGYILASTLDKSWFGVAMGNAQQPSLHYGRKSTDLMKDITSSRKVMSVLGRKSKAIEFERCHLSWSGGYVLDGALYAPSRPYVLQVSQGPRVQLLRWKSSFFARASHQLQN